MLDSRFYIPNWILTLVTEGRPCTFPESRELIILHEANHFALVKGANKSYTNGREERALEITEVHKQ